VVNNLPQYIDDMRIKTEPILFKGGKNKQSLLLRSLAGMFILLLISSCAATNSIAPAGPPITLPATFSMAGEQELQQLWWQELGDQNLQAAIEKSLAQNQSLMGAAERLVQAEALARKAGADLSPSLDAEGSYKKSRSRNDGSTSTSTSMLLGVAASYEIDLWGRLQAIEDAALFDVRASAEDLQAASLSIAAQVANVWYLLAASYMQQELLEQQQELNKVGLELVQMRFNAGQIGIADLLQQKQLIESKNGELAEQRATTRLLENQLAILQGTAPGLLELQNKPELIALPPLPATGIPADLLTNRPDIRSSYLALQAADKRVAAAVADRYPRLSLSAELNTSGTQVRDLFDNWLASLAANIVAPIFDGGSRQAEVERTQASAREKLYSYGDSLLTAMSEVEDALVQEKEQLLLISSLEIQLDLATKTVRSLRDRYKQGTADYQRILDAVLSQQSLQRSLVTNRQQLIGYRIDLYRALGGKPPVVTTEASGRTTTSIARIN
jgi:NodT family efflux transporter outer membrane factor (OMF) lipoprotein